MLLIATSVFLLPGEIRARDVPRVVVKSLWLVFHLNQEAQRFRCPFVIKVSRRYIAACD